MRLAVLALALSGASPLHAQDDARLALTYPLEQRVRVTAPRLGVPPVVGRVARVDSSHLAVLVTGGGTMAAIPLASISAIHADLGIDRGRGAMRGALVGLGLGAYFFATEYRGVRDYDAFGLGTLALTLVSFGIAPAAGAAIGYVIAPRTWSPMALPAPTAPEPATPGIRFAANEHVRLRTAAATFTGRVDSQMETLVTVATGDATTPVKWSDVRRVQVRGGKDRVKGAVAGALLFIGLGVLGEQTAPTTSTSERIGAFTGATVVGAYLGSKFLAPRGWSDLPLVSP